MDIQPAEKVYVAVGNDLQDGLCSLSWTIRNWSSQSISIVILHVNNTSQDFVYTPFGKLPSSSINDEKLGVLKMCEQEKIDKLLTKFISFCTKYKVQAEILKIGKADEPIHRVVVGLMSKYRITKLVMGITFIRSLSRKAKSSTGGSFYVHKNKPEFCELYIICGEKLVHLREENDEGKVSLKGWFGKMLAPNNYHSTQYVEKDYVHDHVVPFENRDWWKNFAEEIEIYSQWLLLNSTDEEEKDEKEEICKEDQEVDGDSSSIIPNSSLKLIEQIKADPNMNVSDKIATLRAKIEEGQKITEEKRKEAKANIDRQEKAQRIISLCNKRTEELEECINKEINDQIDIKINLDTVKEELDEVSKEIKENKNRLKTILELQSELAKKLQHSSIAKSSVEAQLENAMVARAETIQDIDRFRSQKDVLRQRIDFCREIEAINSISTTTTLMNLNYNYREFKVDEIREATSHFSEGLKLKSRGGVESNVFKGRLHHSSVVIILQDSLSSLSQEEYQLKMARLYQIRHPNIITMMGACSGPKCIIYEYIHNQTGLEDILLSSSSSHVDRRRLTWVTRIRIATEICSGLGFLHSVKPRPIIHGNLHCCNILLDCNLVVKITNFKLDDEPDDLQAVDMSAFGVLMLQLLTGREEVGLVEEVTRAMECKVLIEVLDDEMAREWPLDLADEFAGIALRCVHVRNQGQSSTGVRMNTVMRELEELRKKAAEMVSRGESEAVEGSKDREEYCTDVPDIFLCPILREVMKNPHVAADGFTYELEAMEEWMGKGKETSPMTNMKLNHKLLTPNHTLRSLINDWRHHLIFN